MLPAIGALKVDVDGIVTLQSVAAAGSVPATATVVDGLALKADGSIYVVLV